MEHHVGKWHKIPTWLKPAAFLFAAICWSFGQSKTLYSADDKIQLRFIGRIYSFTLGYMMELSSGNWYFKFGDLK